MFMGLVGVFLDCIKAAVLPPVYVLLKDNKQLLFSIQS